MVEMGLAVTTDDVDENALRRQLASSDKTTREEALTTLERRLGTTDALDELEMVKAWQGLFYCFYMSDKTVVQYELAGRLAGLLQVVHERNWMAFFAAFWATVTDRWTGIDRLRLDKYLMLVRRFLAASFDVLETRFDFSQESVEAFIQIMSAFALEPTDAAKPDGLRYHLSDIWLEELARWLAKPGGNKVARRRRRQQLPLLPLVTPFVILYAQSPSKGIVNHVASHVLKPLFLDALPPRGNELEPLVRLLRQSVSSHDLADKLFSIGARDDTAQTNRTRIYELVRHLRASQESVLGRDDSEGEGKGEGKDDSERWRTSFIFPEEPTMSFDDEAFGIEDADEMDLAEGAAGLAVTATRPTTTMDPADASRRRSVSFNLGKNTVRRFKKQLPITFTVDGGRTAHGRPTHDGESSDGVPVKTLKSALRKRAAAAVSELEVEAEADQGVLPEAVLETAADNGMALDTALDTALDDTSPSPKRGKKKAKRRHKKRSK